MYLCINTFILLYVVNVCIYIQQDILQVKCDLSYLGFADKGWLLLKTYFMFLVGSKITRYIKFKVKQTKELRHPIKFEFYTKKGKSMSLAILKTC